MSAIKPAFSRAEWDARFAENLSVTTRLDIACDAFGEATGGRSLTHHQIAALAMFGQSFGFTREDVEALRDVARQISDGAETSGAWVTPHSGWADDALRRIADRIEALLPPDAAQ